MNQNIIKFKDKECNMLITEKKLRNLIKNLLKESYEDDFADYENKEKELIQSLKFENFSEQEIIKKLESLRTWVKFKFKDVDLSEFGLNIYLFGNDIEGYLVNIAKEIREKIYSKIWTFNSEQEIEDAYDTLSENTQDQISLNEIIWDWENRKNTQEEHKKIEDELRNKKHFSTNDFESKIKDYDENRARYIDSPIADDVKESLYSDEDIRNKIIDVSPVIIDILEDIYNEFEMHGHMKYYKPDDFYHLSISEIFEINEVVFGMTNEERHSDFMEFCVDNFFNTGRLKTKQIFDEALGTSYDSTIFNKKQDEYIEKKDIEKSDYVALTQHLTKKIERSFKLYFLNKLSSKNIGGYIREGNTKVIDYSKIYLLNPDETYLFFTNKNKRIKGSNVNPRVQRMTNYNEFLQKNKDDIESKTGVKYSDILSDTKQLQVKSFFNLKKKTYQTGIVNLFRNHNSMGYHVNQNNNPDIQFANDNDYRISCLPFEKDHYTRDKISRMLEPEEE